MEFQNRQVDVVEELGMVLDTVAAGEENNNLLLQVTLEERKQQQKPLIRFTKHISLLQTFDRTVFLAVVDVDVQRTRAQRDPCQILDLGSLGGGEEHGLTFLGRQDLDDLAHFVFETDFENAVCFVDDEGLEILEDEALGVLEVIEETAGGCNEEVDTLGELFGFGAAVGASDDDAVGLGVVGHEFSGDTENLQGQFTGGRDNENTGT